MALITKRLSIGILLFLGHSVFAAGWSRGVISLPLVEQALPRGVSAVSIGLQHRVIDQKYSSVGAPKTIKKTTKLLSSDDVSSEDYSYQVKIEELTTLTSWRYGLTSGWTVGALIPVTDTKFEEAIAAEGVQHRPRKTQIGNIELQSNVRANSIAGAQVHITQKVGFPSAEPTYEGRLPDSLPDPNGFSFGVGVNFIRKLRDDIFAALILTHEVNLPDTIPDSSNVKNVTNMSRDPGDESGGSILLLMKKYSPILMAIGFSSFYKTKDNLTADNESHYRTAFSDTQQAEAVVAYAPTRSAADWKYMEVADNFTVQLKYIASLKGRNIEKADSLGLQVQVYY